MKLPFKNRGDAAPDRAEGAAPVKKRKKPKHLKRIVALVVLMGIAGGAGYRYWKSKNTDTTQTYTDATVARRDIQSVLTGTGTLAPLNQYDVTTLVKGEVTSCTFEQGDVVKQGDLLYTIDSSDVQDSIDRSQISVQQSELSYQQQLENLADLTVKAEKSGVVTDVAVEVGDDLKAGDTIATVRDSATMKLKVPFNSADAQNFHVGQAAAVTIDGSFETLSGAITAIDGADTVLSGYQMVRYVTIAVTNPGALSSSASATATVAGIACNTGAAFEYNAESTITAAVAGKLASLSIREGGTVTAGQVAAKLASTELQNQVKNAQLSLESAQKSLQSTVNSLEDYNITAPISGTIVTRNTKAGDSIDSSSGITALAVIYDMSALKFDIALDELDVNEVAVGQSVEVEVDALDGETFTGKITNISVAGTTTNGATTYPVTVQIENPPEKLLPGMNVNASIIVDEAKDAIAVPVAAIQRGNTVYVKNTDGTQTDTASDSNATDPQDANAPAAPTAGDATRSAAGKSGQRGSAAASKVPDGYHAVSVKTGLSDDSYIEVTSGLREGDIVYVPQVTHTSDSSKQQQGMPGMGGGMAGGDMSRGSGGPPSGGGMGGGGGMPG